MHASYDDITSRIGAPPIWFDEYAVPRYCAFEPERAAGVYIAEVALAEITCQDCGRRILVAFSRANASGRSIAEAIRERSLHYGDPPRHENLPGNPRECVAGATMNSEPRRVVEYWYNARWIKGDRTTVRPWVRDPSLEVNIEPTG